MSKTVGVTPAQARDMLTGPQSDAVKMIRDTARQVLNQAKLRSPVDTGQLRNSHAQGPVTVAAASITTYVEAAKEYAAAVHDGTGPRIIRPRHGKTLKFTGRDGKPVFARQVNMPARRPRPWLRNALQDVAGRRGFIVTGGR